MSDIPLETLVSAIGSAVQKANEKLHVDTVHHFKNYFDEELDEQGNVESLSPQTINFHLPHGDGSHKKIKVPTAALAHHHSLSINQVKVEIAIRSFNWEPKEEQLMVNVGPPDREEDNQSNCACHKISLDFKMHDTPEGKSRAYHNLIKHI